MERLDLPDEDAIAAAAFGLLVDAIRSAPPGPVAICLTGGSSPLPLYDRLAAGRDALAPALDRLHWFMGDERMVPPGDPESNFGAARRRLLEPLAVPAGQLHPIETVGVSPAEAAADYQRELQGFYGAATLDPGRPLFAVTLLGVGPDGHTASLFPGSPALREEARWVVGVEEAGQPPFVPRVTLTLPALASSRLTLVLLPGASKGRALAGIEAGADLPAAKIRSAGRLLLLTDRAAREAAAEAAREP